MTKSTKKTNRRIDNDYVPDWLMEAIALEADAKAEVERGYTSVAPEAFALESYFRGKKLP